MKSIIVLLFSLFLCSLLPAQNLVRNPSFELYTTCPDNIGQVTRATYWLNPTNGSPDYFNSCSANPKTSTPNSTTLGFQMPRNGNAYIGGNLYSKTGTYRDYVYTQLSVSLKVNKRYEVKFFVNLSDSIDYGINRIGAYLSSHIPIPSVFVGTGPLNMYTPQINNSVNRLIVDKEDWTEISGTYTALGGERYITLGNFYIDDSVTSLDTPPLYSIYGAAYYLFDDVSVIELNDYDLGISSIDVNENCYGIQDTVKITLTNAADSAIDFTIDTVSINLDLSVNNVLFNSYSYVLNDNNLNPQFGRPLMPDSSVIIELTSVDFSRYDSTYLLTASLEMKRDINDTNNSLTKTIIPKLSIGNIASLPNEVCFGTSVVLSAANIIGAGNWQFSDDGIAFQNYQPNDTLVQQVFQPTFYRYQVCNTLFSNSFLIQVNNPPKFPDSSFISCDNNWVLTPFAELPNQTFAWFYPSDTINSFYTGDTLIINDTSNQFFYIKSVVDSCYANQFSKIILTANDCDTLDDKSRIVIPNVITPNGDGINDYFIYQLEPDQFIETIIIDRWGGEVAKWSGNLPWRAENIEAGTYFVITKTESAVYKNTLTILK